MLLTHKCCKHLKDYNKCIGKATCEDKLTNLKDKTNEDYSKKKEDERCTRQLSTEELRRAKKDARMQNGGARMQKLLTVCRRGWAGGGVRGGKPPQIRSNFD